MGEATERLWAYLRRFSTITKKMTPTGRMETLSSALLHFAYQKQGQLAIILFILHYWDVHFVSYACDMSVKMAISNILRKRTYDFG